MKSVTMWAWKIQDLRTGKWVLCHWAWPSRAQLVRRYSPSPEARPVRIRCTVARKGAKRG
jgi:hypothetical protein